MLKDKLQEFLRNIGVKDYFSLDEYEKAAYRSLQERLSGRKLTDREVKEYLDRQLEITLTSLENPENNPKLDIFLKSQLRFLRGTLKFLDSPLIEKQQAEQELAEAQDKARKS